MAALDLDDDPPEAIDRRLLLRLIGYLRPHWPLVVLSLGLLVVHAALAVVGPTLTQRALDHAVPAGDTETLTRYAIWFGGAIAITFVVDYTQAIVTTRICQRVMMDLRLAIFSHLQRLSIPFFDRHPIGRLMTRVTSDVETLNELFASGVVAVFGDLATLVAITAAMFAIDARLALLALVGLPAMALVVGAFRPRIRDAFRTIRQRVAKLNSFLQERLSGVEVVQLFRREAADRSAFDAINRGHLDAHLRSITIYAVFFPLVELVTAVAMALLLAQGSGWIVEGSLSVGVLAAFLQLVRRFFQPLQDLSEKINLLQGATASSERVFRLLDTEVSVPDPAAPLPLPSPVRGAVIFENVWFRYADDGPWVLEDVSFRVPAAHTVALVGHTGAGKTTIVSLLLRFHDPVRGRILLDGVDIRSVSLAELRRQYGFVQQDLFLFRGDLMRNLALDPETTETRVREAVRDVGVDGFVERLPGQYAHVLAERGTNVSVGERQLLSFARALARNPAILLLDEATSSIDSESEARIQRGVDRLMSSRTAIVVAHRLSTILHADEILVLHHGRIVERGRHNDLLTARGVYERLFRLQIGRRPANSC